jgi:Fic family protein
VIEEKRNDYYDALKEGQRSNEITPWIEYFVHTIIEAQRYAESLVLFTIKKIQYFLYFRDRLNERQLKVIQRMFEEGPKGFEGGMRARKYKSITSVSKATATRNLQDLVDKKALIPKGGERSTRYELNLDLTYITT